MRSLSGSVAWCRSTIDLHSRTELRGLPAFGLALTGLPGFEACCCKLLTKACMGDGFTEGTGQLQPTGNVNAVMPWRLLCEGW